MFQYVKELSGRVVQVERVLLVHDFINRLWTI